MKKKILLVAGARPNFMKIAPLVRYLKESKCLSYKIVHTGQHYDYNMDKIFFETLELPDPDYHLHVGSASHAVQTAKIMTEMEKVLEKEKPACVVVVGDVNSTVAASLTAIKMGIKVAHVEAGLRSFDRTMPEEINRVITDSIADFLYVTEQSGVDNLKKEGVAQKKIVFVGHVMIDNLFYEVKKLQSIDKTKMKTYRYIKDWSEYAVLTLHRPANVDDKKQLQRVLGVIDQISKMVPIICPLHPRTKQRCLDYNIEFPKGVTTIDPTSIREMVFLMKNSALVLTDSGGIQEETTALGVPCFTIRESTERPITVTIGTNTLITNKKLNQLPKMVEAVLSGTKVKKGKKPPKWDGQASKRIIDHLCKNL